MKRKILKTLIISTLIASNTFTITASAVEISTETATIENSSATDNVTAIEKGTTTDSEIYKTNKGQLELWKLRDGTYEISSYSGSDTTLRIPDAINGYPVTTISPYMLSEVNSTVKELVLPKELECIDGKYLEKFSALEKISINNGTRYVSENGILFTKDKTELACFPNSKNILNYTVPDSVTTIACGAFMNNKYLKSVNLPSKLINIQFSCFMNSNIESITIPSNVQTIDTFAFKNCNKLNSIKLNDRLLTISYQAFSGCTSLKELTIPSSVKNLYSGSLYGIVNLKSLTVLSKSVIYEDEVLSNLKNTTLYGYAGSTTETYAKEHGFTFVKLTESSATTELTVSGTCKVGNTITVSTPRQNDVQYEYKLIDKKTGASRVIKNMSSLNSTSVKLTNSGDKIIRCTIKYPNRTETVDKEIKVANSFSITSLVADKTSPQLQNSVIKLKANVSGTGTLQYKFLITDGRGNWSVLKNYSSSNTCDWKASYPGTKTLYVDVKDSYGNVIRKGISYKITQPLTVSSFKSDKTSPQTVKTSVKLTAQASGGEGTLKYKFYRYLNGSYATIKDWSTTNNVTIAPSTAGTYDIYVAVKDSTGKIVRKNLSFKFNNAAPTINSFTANKVSPQAKGTKVTLTAKATGTGRLQYRFRIGTANGNHATIRDWSTSNTTTWSANYVGDKILYVDVKDSAGKITTKTMNYRIVQIVYIK